MGPLLHWNALTETTAHTHLIHTQLALGAGGPVLWLVGSDYSPAQSYTPHDLLLQGALGDEPVHIHHLLLPNPMSTIHGLQSGHGHDITALKCSD